MIEILSQLAPIFFYFGIGVLLKHFGLADRTNGDFILRLVFFVTLPLLILTTIPNAELSAEKAMLPLTNILVNLLCLGTVLLVIKPIKLEKSTQGSMVMNTMIANNAFMFPFILTIYGDEGFADAILFDFGNALMVATFTFAMAFRYSSESHDSLTMLKRIATSPLFWALGIGIVLSITENPLPTSLEKMARPVAQMTSPLILIALGIFFSLSVRHLKLVGLALSIRMLLGFVFGLAAASILGLEGHTFVVAALCSAAPIGFMALTFSSMAKLDMELTTSAVSLSILIGLFWIPLLIVFFQ